MLKILRIRRVCRDEVSDAILSVEKIDLFCNQNSIEHNTNRYYDASDVLIVRRGVPFRIAIEFNRSYISTKDTISFNFTIADEENVCVALGNVVTLDLQENVTSFGLPHEWIAGIEKHDGPTLTVLIKPAATCAVAKWQLVVDTKQFLDICGGYSSYQVPILVYILFNPWCSEDQVYIAEADKREEYIMYDMTLIPRGTHRQKTSLIWKLGQFDQFILDCSFMLVEKLGHLSALYRGDPVRVARVLAASINAKIDKGVLAGRWDGYFSGGTNPTKWLSSTEILHKFYKTQKPVKFGNCWNFAGVLTTIARALGIPARIVTCFKSTPNHSNFLTKDKYVDINFPKKSHDKLFPVWNYRVLCEMWMTRPDLGGGDCRSYDGWQMLDAASHSIIDNTYSLGPASIFALKQGEAMRPFDTDLIYSQMNADILYWRFSRQYRPVKLIKKDTLSVGSCVATKAVLRWMREDITKLYKGTIPPSSKYNPILEALDRSKYSLCRYYRNEEQEDIDYKIEIGDNLRMGEKFTVLLKVINKSSNETYNIKGHINCGTTFYTGENTQKVKDIIFTITLKPNSKEELPMEVKYKDYMGTLIAQSSFLITAMFNIKENDHDCYAQEEFILQNPNIDIEFQGKIITKEPVETILRFHNPLPVPLKEGTFTVNGTGIEASLVFKIDKIPVNGIATYKFQYTAPNCTKGTLVANFFSKELEDVNGHTHFEVYSNMHSESLQSTKSKVILYTL